MNEIFKVTLRSKSAKQIIFIIGWKNEILLY
jgi:hypothetical protein